MANRTVKGASTIKGTNPQFLIEKIIRSRIYECRYWKEECFALTAELLVDKALELKVFILIGALRSKNWTEILRVIISRKFLRNSENEDFSQGVGPQTKS